MLNPPWARKLGYVASNQLLTEICVFARNIIIARFIGAETLGEFIFLILSIRLFTMSTDLAAERYILQASNQEVMSALATAHFTARIRAVLLGVTLLLMGLFGLQGISFESYALLAGSIILHGFINQGYRLKQRALNFRPALYVEGVTIVFGTLAIYLTAMFVPTLEAVCACLFVQAAFHAALSHIMSSTPYRLDAKTEDLKSLFRYGLPLLLTGVTMFWSMQGERVLLSAMLPAEAFAHFSMMFQLALVPILVMSRMMLTLGLPSLAAVKDNWSEFERRLGQLHIAAYFAGFGFMGVFLFLANPTLHILFGEDFRAEAMLIFLVALAQALRLCRAPQSVAAQALGQTDIPFKANLVRVTAVLVGVAGYALGGTLSVLLLIGCIGEALAWAIQSFLFSLRNRSAARLQSNEFRIQEISS